MLGFVYYDCPMLCGQIVNALTSTLRTVSLDAGRDFEVVLVSFDPRETPALAAAKKAEYLGRYDRAGGGRRLAFSDRPAAVDRAPHAGGRLPLRLGRRRRSSSPIRRASSSSRLTAGRRAICSASTTARATSAWRWSRRRKARSASPVDSFLLYCYHYDPMTGRYGFLVMRALRIAGAATVLALGGFIFIMVRRDRRTPNARSLRPSHFPSPADRHRS